MSDNDIFETEQPADSPESTEQASESSEQTSEDSPEEGSDSSEDIFAEESSSKTVPYSRFRQVNSQKKELEAELDKLRAASEESSKAAETFQRIWGWAEDPFQAAEQEEKLLNALDKLKEEPEVREALKLVRQHIQGNPIVRRETETKPAAPSQPASDPRVEQLIRSQVEEKADSVMESARIRPELRPVLREAVLSQVNEPSQAKIKEALQGQISELGWTKEFVQSPRKKAEVDLPSSYEETGQAAQETPSKPQKPRSRHEAELQRRAKVKDLVSRLPAQ